MPYKIRVQKKKETAPLRLVSRSEELIDQLRSHPKWIWSGIGTGVVLIALFLAGWFLNQRANEKASVLEMEASTLFHEPPPLPQPKEEGKEAPKEMDKTERLKKSVTLYDQLLEKYPRSSSAPIAQYEAGNVYFELKEYGSAEKRYLAFLENYPANKDLASLVHVKLGYLHQAKGDDAAALKQFRLVFEMEGARNKDQAGFEMGRTLEKMESKKEATEVYTKVSQDFALSPWGAEAEARLQKLNPPAVSAPVVPEAGKDPAPAPKAPSVAPPATPKSR